MRESINLGVGALGGVIGWMFGSPDSFFYALIAFMFVDYFSGVIAAGVKKQISSDIGYAGIMKKLCIFMILAVANVVDANIINGGGAIRNAAIFFYLSNEGISILENVVAIGLPVPEKLKIILKQIGSEDNGDKKEPDNTEL